MKTLILFFTLLLISISACSDKNEIRPGNNSGKNDSWLVQKNDIIHWDSEKDRIQSIDTLEFVSVNQSSLKDDDLVFAINYNGTVKVYPAVVLSSHEIANDSIEDYYFSLTYCPITNSAICWNRKINGKVNQFGVSGMLFKNNLIPYDRLTGSHWSQMGNLCINGDLIGKVPATKLLIETNFSTIKAAFPEALILSHQHCADGICVRYKSSSDFGDPNEENDNHLLVDTRYFGIARDQEVLLFSLNLFEEGTHLIQTHFKGQRVIVVGDKSLNYAAAFVYAKDSSDEILFAINNELPVIMGDSKGNRYDLFGTVLDGPEKGKRLSSPNAYIANSFAWNAIFPRIKVYQKD